MRSPVKWALLGLVIERPSHAYELAQRLERRYGPTLPLSDTRHAYRAIKDLANRSLIERIPDAHESADSEPSEPSPSEPSGPSKPSYRATAKGIAEYRAWLIGYIGEERQQRQLFILALSALTRQPEQMIEVVEHCEQEWLAQGMRTPIAREVDTTPDAPDTTPDTLATLHRLIDEENRLTVGAKLTWIHYAREQLEEFAKSRHR